MAALRLDMTIPPGDAGHVTFAADIADLGALTQVQRQVLADTAREFAGFAAATIAPPLPAGVKRDDASDLLRGTGGRA